MTVPLTAELPNPTRPRRLFSAIMVILAFFGDLVAAAMLHATLGEGSFADDTRSWLASRDLALPAAIIAGGLAAFLTTAAYLTTLDWRQRRRPALRLFFIGLGLAIVVVTPLLGLLRFPAEQPVVLAVSVLLCMGLSFLFWPLEWAIGRALGSIAALAAAGKAPNSAWWARQAVRFVPRDPVSRRALGLGLTYAGQMNQAYPHLIHAYALGDRTPPLLWALARATESLGDLTTALSHLEALAGILREDESVLAERIRLNRELGRPAEARALIEELPEIRRGAWRETRLELLLELADVSALAAEAAQFEREQGPPFPRARQILQQIQALAPDEPNHLNEMIRLADLSGDSTSLIGLLEAALVRHKDDAELIRKLRTEWQRQGDSEQTTRLLLDLGRIGAASSAEYLELAALHASRGDDEGMMRQLSMLDGSPARTARGAAMIVRSHFESGRHEEALEAARTAREGGWLVGVAAEEVASIEARITAQSLTTAVRELGRDAAAHPEDMDLQFRYIKALIQSGATDKVVLLGEAMLSRGGEAIRPRLEEEIGAMTALAPQGRSGRLLEYLGDLRLRAGDPDGAMDHYTDASKLSMKPGAVLMETTRRVLASHPNHVKSLMTIADLEMQARDPRAALRHLDQALELGAAIAPADPLRLLEFYAAAQSGATQRAIAAGRLIISAPEFEDDVTIHMQLAELEMTQGHYQQACDLLEGLYQKQPDDMSVRGKLRLALERRKLARIERLRMELSANPRSPDLLEELGDLLLADGQLNEAVVEYQKAAHLGPQYRQARAKLGLCLARKGLHAESEEAYEEAEFQPSLPVEELNRLKDLFYDGALLMERDRESDRALKLHKRISKVDMGYKDVLARIERLTRSQKRRANS